MILECGTLYSWLGKRGDVEERSGGSEDRIGQGKIAEEEGEALQCDGAASSDHHFAVVLDCRFDVRSQIPLKHILLFQFASVDMNELVL